MHQVQNHLIQLQTSSMCIKSASVERKVLKVAMADV